MIRDYANHAANERTFLAWVRTGIAIIALGFVIEKFNLFLLTVAKTLAAEAPYPIQMQKLSGPVGRFGGLALILGGVALIALSASRFIRTRRLLAADETYPASSLRVEKFNLFLLTIARTLAAEAPYPIQMQKLSGAVGRYGGLALILGGVALIVLSASRFMRTRRLLAADETYPASALRVEFVLLMATVLFVAGFSVYAAIG